MALELEFANLPGSRRVYRDYNIRVAEPDVAPGVVTDSVLLIGTAVDGPVNVPYQVRRMVDAEVLFGKMVDENGLPNEMSLVRGAKELYAAGCRDIRLMRIGGTYAEAEITGDSVTQTVTAHTVESLGRASAGEETVITLPLPTGAELVYGSVFVKVDDQPQVFGYTVDYVNATVTFQPGWFRNGASVYISYQYETEIARHDVVGEVLVKESNTVYYLQHGPIVYGTLSVFIDGVEQPATSPDGSIVYWTYDETANKITFTDPQTGQVTANYTYKEMERKTSYATGVIGGTTQVFTLSNTPVEDSVILYANDSVIPKEGYNVNVADKKVFLFPGYAPLLAEIKAEYDYVTTATITPALTIRSIYPGKLYNGVRVTYSVDQQNVGTLSFTKPQGKPGQDFSVVVNNYSTLGKLVEAINNDPRNTYVKLSTNMPDMPPAILNPASVQLAGGTDGPRPSDYDYKTQMYRLLDEAYKLLYDYDVDFVVPLGVYADDPAPGGLNFAEQLANFCAVVSMANSETIGVIGVKPLPDTSPETVKQKVDALCAPGANEYYLKDENGAFIYDDEGNKVDIGRFIVVVAGPEVVFQNEQLGAYAASPAAAFAGVASMLPPHQGVVGQLVSGALGLRYSFSHSQLNRLLGARYVTLHVRPRLAGVFVTDGLTAAAPGSDYRRLTTMRIVAAAAQLIRYACEPFYGLPNTPENRGAMATAIESVLKNMKEAQAITDYKFQIFASLVDQVLGRALIDLTLVPAFEIVQIKTTVTLRPAIQG